MQYHLLNDNAIEPSLMEMSQKALQMVSKNLKGYVLMIESGRIDHGHHETKAKLALEETKHFEEVVAYIRSQTDETDTLIVVTSDHSHTMSVGGYPISEFIYRF
jgi:alkaline phosphatase